MLFYHSNVRRSRPSVGVAIGMVLMAVTSGFPGAKIETNIAQVSEGSLKHMKVASSLAQKPGDMAAFYNPKRRAGRDCSVLSVAQWMANKKLTTSTKSKDKQLPLKILDAHAASGMTGLRVASESSLLAESLLPSQSMALPTLEIMLNDINSEAAQVANHNAAIVSQSLSSTAVKVSVSNQNSQSLWHESSFDVSLIDPFGCTTACLDAALSQTPQGGMLDICATDVTALYGGRPTMAARHYGGAHLTSRPPCFKERGVRLLLAAIAQAAGRQDRGIQPLYSLSTAHYVAVAVQVVRRGPQAKMFGPDASMRQVQRISICRACGAAGGVCDVAGESSTVSQTVLAPGCSCEASTPGVGASAVPEGPYWLGPLHDSAHLLGMLRLANLHEAKGWITPETRKLIRIMYEESVVQPPGVLPPSGLFHRRPSLAAPERMPPLDALVQELQDRGYQACRTQFDPKALKTDAPPSVFDEVCCTFIERR